MSILAECPMCHKKQATKNKACNCGENLDKAKKSKKVRYWIAYRMPGGKQRRESVATMEGLNPYSISDARDAESKRVVQKRENRVFDMLPESNMTFQELSDWYTDIGSVKKLASYERIKIALNNFNVMFGNIISGAILPIDIEDYQAKRLNDGLAASTLDLELTIVKGAVTKAFDNDKISGRVLKAFRKVKKQSKPGANARRRTVTISEYLNLLTKASEHFRPMLIVAMNTGMRPGELRQLRWKHVDRKSGFIKLPGSLTKEGKDKKIPINHHVKALLDELSPGLGVVTENHHDFVFTNTRRPPTTSWWIKDSLRKSCKAAEIPYGRKVTDGIIMHDFRRTVKTNMTSADVNKVYRDLILGHSLRGMDIHYISPSNDDLKQAVDKYTEWLDGQIEALSQNVDHSVDQEGVAKKVRI
ncbi:tyrosine-type recombinase/integrase [Thermodesulfobacteriota bacterium]